MKITIDSIYDDNLTLFSDNTLLLNDDRLTDIMAFKADLDLIASENYGARELLHRMTKHDTTDVLKYNMPKINRHIYACMVENLTKYNTLLSSEEYADVSPEEEYKETYVHGESEQTRDFGSRVDTTTHGNVNITKQYDDIDKEKVYGGNTITNAYGDVDTSTVYGANTTTNTYGDVDTTQNIGQTQDTNVNGARQNTNAVIPSLSSGTFYDTDKTSTNSFTDTITKGAQTNSTSVERENDTTTVSSHTDSESITRENDVETRSTRTDTESISARTDTEATTHGDDTHTYGTHTDVITNDETTDIKSGYKDLWNSIERKRRLYSKSALQIIVNECVNAITYSMYL